MIDSRKERAKRALLIKGESEIWLYSYADLITNLLAFFLMLLIATRMDSRAAEKVKESIAKMVGKETASQGLTDGEIVGLLNDALNRRNLAGSFFVAKTNGGISLTFAEGVFFDTASAELTTEAQEILQAITPIFKQVTEKYSLDVEGHADSRPLLNTKRYASNWELSAARAGAVVRLLTERGLKSASLRAIGYSDTQPISQHLDKNRRVTIRIRDKRT